MKRLAAALLFLLPSLLPAADGWHTIFDGKSLEGWTAPDTSAWSVEDGAITGINTAENPVKGNQFLHWASSSAARARPTATSSAIKPTLTGPANGWARCTTNTPAADCSPRADKPPSSMATANATPANTATKTNCSKPSTSKAGTNTTSAPGVTPLNYGSTASSRPR